MKYKLNPDKKIVDGVITGLKTKDGHCPCSVGKTPENKCPCVGLKTKGICHCGLYISEEVIGK
jgi:ferredoxin-thioredoxin reductase catalytic subunit